MRRAALAAATAVATAVRTAVPRGLSWLASAVQTTHRVRLPRLSDRERQAERARSQEESPQRRAGRPAVQEARKAREAQEGDRRSGPGVAGGRRVQALHAMPRQVVPPTETVDLTPAERAAFAGLVRQFSEGRR